MAFWVYILKCSDGSYYTGHTDNLETRLSQHALGLGGVYTSERQPVSLVYHDMFNDRDTAFRAERRIKGWTRAKKEALMAGDWQKIRRLAVPPQERAARGASFDFAQDERDNAWAQQWK